MITDSQIIDTVKTLLDEKPELFGKDAAPLKQKIDSTPNDDPETMRLTANSVLEVLQKHPEAKVEFLNRLGLDQSIFTRMCYEKPPGGPPLVSARTDMTCPNDCDYRRKLRQKGQRLFCPHCGSELVPQSLNPESE